MPTPAPILPTFAGQNWLITPAALAVNEAPPKTISDQEWLLTLTGVAVINWQGTLPNDWLRQTVTISPDMSGPLSWAISRWSIPKPANYLLGMSLLEWAPFAALSSVFEKASGGVDAGFGVDDWRPTPFPTNIVDVHNNPVSNLFYGIDVDLAVRNNNATIYRVSYDITLLGKIVFLPGLQ